MSAKIADRHADALSGEGRWGRLQNKLSALQEQAGAYQQTETRLRQLQTQVDQLEQDASRQQEALHRIQRLTEQKEGLERRLRMASQTDPRQIQAEIERLSGQLNTRQAEITQLLGRQADLQRQTAAQQGQLTDLQQQIDSAEPALRQVEDQVRQQKERLGMMAAKKAELVRCQEDLESSREKYDVLQRELEDRQRQLQNLQQEQSALELRHETLKDQLSKLDPEVQRLRSENEVLARQEADALSRQDRQLAEVAERLKQMRDVADALRGDSGLLEPMYDRKPFALDDVLQSGFQQAETAISDLRQAIVSYQEICGGSHTD